MCLPETVRVSVDFLQSLNELFPDLKMRAAVVGTLLLLALAVSTSARRNSKRMLIEEAASPAEYKDAKSGRARQGRQIQPLACVSKSGGEKGVCMFAWNCVEAGGQHLGTCIDRYHNQSSCFSSSSPASQQFL